MGYIKTKKGLILKRRDVKMIRRGNIGMCIMLILRLRRKSKWYNIINDKCRKILHKFLNDVMATAWPIKKSSENFALPKSIKSNIEIEQIKEA